MSVLPINILQSFAAPPEIDLTVEISSCMQQRNAVVVVVDDDPTGAQYAGVSLLTEWSTQIILGEIKRGSSLFFLLTNTRSMPVEEAMEVNREAGKNIKQAFAQTNKQYVIVSRSDSTLRGHFPQEVNALAEGLQIKNYLTAIIPAYIEAGRFTINNVQYVQEGDQLLPVHLTPFSKDRSFGYSAENLVDWIGEKSGEMIDKMSIASFDINELRTSGKLVENLYGLPSNSTFIVNAISLIDLQLFVRAYLKAGIKVIFRTGPSFIGAIGGFNRPTLLSVSDIISDGSSNGGLIIVGSYVPRTNDQLAALLQVGIDAIELNVHDIIEGSCAGSLQMHLQKMQGLLNQQKDVVIYTSRQMIHGVNSAESLHIGKQISSYLVQLVKQLTVQPRYIIAKGGITSHDIAVKALGIKRAEVKGHLLKGLPVWQAGEETLFPGMPYVVFPGNVGNENTLVEAYEKLLKYKKTAP